MERRSYSSLLTWKRSPQRKPLILQGARQVGKTYLLKDFGKREYENVAYFNFEESPQLHSLFEPDLNPKRILEALSLFGGAKIDPGKTLVIFDEVQASPLALTSLKYFCEQAESSHIIAAGSLLGIKMAEASSFPVGKVNFLHLYPLTFLEFLQAVEKGKLGEHLEKRQSFTPLEEVFHQQLLYLFKLYLFIGGMPEAVLTYKNLQDFEKIRLVQLEILKSYENDFSKYATKSEALKIAKIWHSAPLQLAKEQKKFQYAEIKRGGRAKEFEGAIDWLVHAGLVHLSCLIKKPEFPLKAFQDEAKFKVYVLDTGLLGAMLGLSAKTIVDGNTLFAQFNGAFIENHAAQELKAYGHELFYWASPHQAEVDFVVSNGESIYPLEIKTGLSRDKRSLKVYGEKYSPKILSRATLRNLKHDGDIANYPLYALSLFPILNQ